MIGIGVASSWVADLSFANSYTQLGDTIYDATDYRVE